MRYIYMNNFRGFTDTVIPLRQTNFLVGENSTGKSSFLSLLTLASQPQFWFMPDFSFQDELDLGGFNDIVSAWAEDKTDLQVGVVNTKKSDKSGRIELAFNIHTFAEKNGAPKLSQHSQLADNQLTTLVFESSRTKFRVRDFNSDFASEGEAIAEFRKIINSERDIRGLKTIPKTISADLPLSIAISVALDLHSNAEKKPRYAFKTRMPLDMGITWFAPIRTKPKRFYEGMKRNYSPEGEHSPMLLREALKSRTRSSKFAKSLEEFGNSSGLFETVIAHTFGKGSQTPFELLVKFSGAELNINNVGYGVSQALPLVVEFLTSEKRQTFAVQQPEVHLHPKAQAALGGLIFELAKERGHAFFIETHSDYLIDRYRLSMSKGNNPPDSQVVFFVRTAKGNKAHVLPISNDGLYPKEQPKEFRSFFINEEMKLLDI